MTLASVSEAPKKRRRYTVEFKARIVDTCQQPGASIARIAQDHGLNANLVHKWIPRSPAAGRHIDASRLSAHCITGPFSPTARVELWREYPHRDPAYRLQFGRELAPHRRRSIPALAPGSVAMIRIDEIWLATEPLDMRAAPRTLPW